MTLNGARTRTQERAAGQAGELPRIRGFLLVYLIALTAYALHGSLLTVGSVVVYTHSVVAGSHSHVTLGFLIFYVITNAALILYVIYLFILMSQRRKSAIRNNIVFNILAVVFLVAWHVAGEKSNVGTVVDAIPNLAAVPYFLLSRRVRNTFVAGQPAGS